MLQMENFSKSGQNELLNLAENETISMGLHELVYTDLRDAGESAADDSAKDEQLDEEGSALEG